MRNADQILSLKAVGALDRMIARVRDNDPLGIIIARVLIRKLAFTCDEAKLIAMLQGLLKEAEQGSGAEISEVQE
jgi:hypothetical protein